MNKPFYDVIIFNTYFSKKKSFKNHFFKPFIYKINYINRAQPSAIIINSIKKIQSHSLKYLVKLRCLIDFYAEIKKQFFLGFNHGTLGAKNNYWKFELCDWSEIQPQFSAHFTLWEIKKKLK